MNKIIPADKLKLLTRITIFCGLLALPFFYWKKAAVPFEIPKVYLFQRWIELLTILTIFRIYLNTKILKKIRVKIIVLVACFITIAILSSLFGTDIIKSLNGNYYRDDGIITLLHLALLSFVISVNWDTALFKIITLAFFLSSTLNSLIIVSNFILNNLHLTRLNNWSSFGNPNFLGGYLTVSIPFCLLFLNKKYSKIISTLIILLIIYAIILTHSWSGTIVSFIATAGYILLKYSNHKQIKIVVIGFLLISTVLLSFYLTRYISEKKQNRGFMPQSRERILVKSYFAFLERPILGWGWANFDYAFVFKDWPERYYHDVYVDKAHSTILEVFTTTGILGGLTYLYLIYTASTVLYKNKQTRFFCLVLLIYLIHSQTNVISITEELTFWLCLGVSVRQ